MEITANPDHIFTDLRKALANGHFQALEAFLSVLDNLKEGELINIPRHGCIIQNALGMLIKNDEGRACLSNPQDAMETDYSSSGNSASQRQALAWLAKDTSDEAFQHSLSSSP